MRIVYFDVTSTLRLDFTTGVQRVVRELTHRLCSSPLKDLHFVPIVYCPGCDGWRRLSENEYRRLIAIHPLPQEPPKLKIQWAGLLRTVVSTLPGFRLKERLRRVQTRRMSQRNHPTEHARLALTTFETDSVFLDLDSAWHSPVNRSSLLPALRAQGVSIFMLHYDIVALLFPDLVPAHTARLFKCYFEAHVKFGDLIACISDCSQAELREYCASRYPDIPTHVARIELGADFSAQETDRRPWPLPPHVSRYVLSVGTIEPRKNHERLLDAFEVVGSEIQNVSLVIVGRYGWKSCKLVRRISNHRWLGTRLFWLEGIDDCTLAQLYRDATLCVVPSLYEGYGLPVSEALAHGCVTLSSRGGALVEAGRGFAEYFNARETEAMIALIKAYLTDSEKLTATRKRLHHYRPITWDDTARQLTELVRGAQLNAI